MTDKWKSFVLPDNFKPAEHGGLLEFLHSHAASAVRVDAGNLRRLDSVLIELLLCAAKTWRDADLPFEVANLSRSNADVVATLGLAPEHFCGRAAA